MTFEARLLVVVLAAFTVTGILAATVVPMAARRAARRPVASRPDALLRARLLPCSSGLVAAALTALAYLVFERRGPEAVGLVLPALAAAGLALISAGALQLSRTARATNRVVTQWMQMAEPVALPGVTIPAFALDAAFPIVAVVGIVRPRLVIARSVLAACPREELAAILAHEQHHVDRRDNLRRAVMTALPDLFSWLPASRTLVADWRDAGEHAADQAAGRIGSQGRQVLAQALIRVARLAPAGMDPGALPASALYRGGSLEHRVRGLLEPPAPTRCDAPRLARSIAAVLPAAALVALESVHAVVELAVTQLP